MPSTNENVRHAPQSRVDRQGAPFTPATAAADVDATLRILEGRWKLLILFQRFGGRLQRLSDLERAMPAVSQKMLVRQLRLLEKDGVVRRIVHHQVPPKVE